MIAWMGESGTPGENDERVGVLEYGVNVKDDRRLVLLVLFDGVIGGRPAATGQRGIECRVLSQHDADSIDPS
jgi:hypothetical protein